MRNNHIAQAAKGTGLVAGVPRSTGAIFLDERYVSRGQKTFELCCAIARAYRKLTRPEE